MTLHNISVKYLQYNLWANERVASWLKSLDQNILYTETGSSFRTSDQTLQHIIAGQLYWYDIIVNDQINEFNLPLKENAVHEVLNDLVTTSKRLVDNVSIFTNEQLMEHIRASDSTQSRYEYILHVVNHSTYHRGQIVTMSRALGVKSEIPVTDYDGYLWWLENM